MPEATTAQRISRANRVLQSALAVQRRGRYQVEAAIAALHDDAASAEETCEAERYEGSYRLCYVRGRRGAPSSWRNRSSATSGSWWQVNPTGGVRPSTGKNKGKGEHPLLSLFNI